ncbi:hypothetical protein LY78DRAFT_448508 [Colletotrichum sublineola]|nr:hypothetical protein LY78DRAFT_448508 [Colletotrichum sublineola]
MVGCRCADPQERGPDRGSLCALLNFGSRRWLSSLGWLARLFGGVPLSHFPSWMRCVQGHGCCWAFPASSFHWMIGK